MKSFINKTSETTNISHRRANTSAFLIFVVPNSFTLNSEHPAYFLMSGDRSEYLIVESVMKIWCEMSYSSFVRLDKVSYIV
jgi:hypothetical protein